MKARLVLLVVLATTACAKQGTAPARAQYPDPPGPDIYHLCTDARFQSMCTPAPPTPAQDEQPVRVDVNLTAPNVLHVSAG